jgi:4-amino-4-deoxy-L-arabinose transferase-like glycosyltransferase
MSTPLPVLFGAAWCLATAWALGALLLQRLRLNLYREERPLFAFLGGSAVLSLFTFALAAAQALYAAAFLATGAAALFLAWRNRVWRSDAPPLPPLPRFWRFAFPLLYAPFALLALIHALAPERSPDGSSYHLGIIARYYHHHGFERITTHMYANLSQGLEMLFLHAWAFGRHSAAALVHSAFLLALPLLLLNYGRRTGHPAAGAAAGLFFLLSPVAAVDGASAYNDVAVAACLFAIFYLLEAARSGVTAGLAALAGLLAGFCYALKYTAFLAVPFAFFGLSLALRGRKKLKPLAIFTLCALLMIAPWVLRNAVWFGNPFSPLLNRWFPNPYVTVSFERDYAAYMRKYVGLESYRQLPLELTVKGGLLGGFLGPLFLLAPLALFALRSSTGRRALFAAALFALPYAANVGTRFLIPPLPFLALALALAPPARWRTAVLAAALAGHAAASWPSLASRYCVPYAWRISEIPWRAALRMPGTDEWLRQVMPSYATVEMIERATPPDAVVFAFTPLPESYTSRQIRIGYQSAEGERLLDALHVALTPDFQPVLRHQWRFEPGTFDALRITQTAPAGPPDLWSAFEIHVLGPAGRLPRDPRWTLRAHPWPWSIQLAFDNDPVTRWRSWEPIRPGMFIEIGLGREESVSGLQMDHAHDQYAAAFLLEGRGAPGRWTALGAPVRSELPPPLGLRRAAVEELKRAGVTHLLVTPRDYRAADYAENAALWGLAEAGETGGARLFRLE